MITRILVQLSCLAGIINHQSFNHVSWSSVGGSRPPRREWTVPSGCQVTCVIASSQAFGPAINQWAGNQQVPWPKVSHACVKDKKLSNGRSQLVNSAQWWFPTALCDRMHSIGHHASLFPKDSTVQSTRKELVHMCRHLLICIAVCTVVKSIAYF